MPFIRPPSKSARPRRSPAFTLSDFSRTYNPDSTSGTDHAWGGHHLIMGGAVKGGDFYGTFPTLALSGS